MSSSSGYTSILVVGSDGQIGRQLVIAAQSLGKTVWQTTRRREAVTDGRLFLDLSLDAAGWPLPNEGIDVAIFCGAVTSSRICADHAGASERVNVAATTVLARRLVDAGAFVIFLSTNQVFNGRQAFAKVSDATDPQTEYGRQKAEAEKTFVAFGGRGAILRMSKVLTLDYPLFRDWQMRLKSGDVIRPFDDMVLAPVAVNDAVDVLVRIMNVRASGITQLSADRDVIYAEVAKRLAACMGASEGQVQPVSCRQSDLDFVPRHTTLDGTRLKTDFQMVPPDVWRVVNSCVIDPLVTSPRRA